jgi:hypothetical protein
LAVDLGELANSPTRQFANLPTCQLANSPIRQLANLPSLDFHGDPFSRPVAMEFRESPQIVAVAVSYLDD